MAGPNTGCGCMTNRTGSLIIGWIEVIFSIPLLLLLIIIVILGMTGIPGECPVTNLNDAESVVRSAEFYLKNDKCIEPEIRKYFVMGGLVGLVVCSIYLIGSCCLIHGVSNKIPSFLIPYIVIGILKKFVALIGIILVGHLVDPFAVILPMIGFAFSVWKTVVVSSHYCYLTAKPDDGNEMLVNKGVYVHL